MTADGRRRRGDLGYDAAAASAGFAPLDQAFDADSLYALRAAVAARAAAAGLDRIAIYDVTATAHELAANAVVHGAGHGQLRLWADGEFLYCQVTDDGRARDAGDAGDTGDAGVTGDVGEGAVPWPVKHGHGLWLVRELTGQLRIGHGPAGTTAMVRFALTWRLAIPARSLRESARLSTLPSRTPGSGSL